MALRQIVSVPVIRVIEDCGEKKLKDFASKLGTSGSLVRYWRSSSKMSVKFLYKIEKAYGLNIESYLTDEVDIISYNKYKKEMDLCPQKN